MINGFSWSANIMASPFNHNDPWVESHMWLQETWGQRSSWGQWPLVHGTWTEWSLGRLHIYYFKGALDKYIIYLFISTSIEDFKSIQ